MGIEIMNLNKLKKQYTNLLNDIEFVELYLGLKKPNIFKVLSISKKEIRHSNFLAWLLDPSESHKLGGVFLKRFLREVGLTAEEVFLKWRLAPLQTRRDVAGLGLIHRTVLGQGPIHFCN